MRLTEFLTRPQVETIHRNALRLLAEMGARVEHKGVQAKLAALGGEWNSLTDTVRFAPPVVESLIAAAPKYPREEGLPPSVTAQSGVYQSYYLDPATGKLLPFDENRLARFIGFSRSLPKVQGVGVLGVPFLPEGIPPACIPLAEKLFCWKYGAHQGGSVHLTRLCGPLLDVFECHARYQGKNPSEVFGATGYLISPFKLARPECEQMLYFDKRGFRMGIGYLPMQGSTAPVTLAGSLTQSLAEQIFLFLLHRSFWEDVAFGLGGSISTVDMRTGVSCYGRPEMQRVNVAFADIARFYSCSGGAHTGLTDAKVPSFEAGAQKGVGALISALATGHGSVSAGLLGMDEICSPVQMILDLDLTESLEKLLTAPAVDDTECAFEEIAAAGIGGNHLGTDFTAERFRHELFQPLTWSGQFVSGWLKAGSETDIDFALEIALQYERRFTPYSLISEEEERDLRKIIGQAAKSLPGGGDG